MISFAMLGAFMAGPVAASPASAASSGCSSTSSGGTVITPPTIGGQRITFDQAVHVFVGTYCPGAASMTGDLSWTPPACWWQPIFTPQQLKDFAYSYYDTGGGSADFTWNDLLAYYEGKGQTQPAGYTSTSGPPYSNWNVGASPGGEWWGIVFNEAMMDTPQFLDCEMHSMNADGKPWTWVATGAPAPANLAEPVVTREEVAEYAASIMQLPGSDFQSSPQNGQTVNLPMWVWAGDRNTGTGPYAPQKLKACAIDLSGAPQACATVTATAQSFTIDPGTPNNAADAVVYDAGCKPTADGFVGEPYSTGQTGPPPCGVTYLHSTTAQGQTYKPSVTVDWSINWDGTGGGTWPKPDAIPGLQHPVTVQEIQTIVGQ
ncbi:hypothetical protein KGA66_27275 [Actinocrinis puniceicyclus]|uniref:Secreted protein n=1 Tax=Actinocrinis puniceicyclus TaxID=977794 RepID=A0A8J7WSH9_9ACTN|nr:hypothetical protein [Actinocrinis puniceicyclus]MBS2966768.1 hypothetical protein [Actinocrinis puniceicyclus]